MKNTMGTCGYVVKITQKIEGEILAVFFFQNALYKTLDSAREGQRIYETDYEPRMTENGSRVECNTSIERIWFNEEWMEGDSTHGC